MNWHASKKVWIDLGCKYAVGNIGWTTAYGMIAMLNSRVIREKDAHLHFELMAYLIRQFGPPPRPPVPSPLRTTSGLEMLAWKSSDTRSIFHWALDYFGEIKSNCRMRDLEADLVPEGDTVETQDLVANHRLDVLAAGRIPYQTNKVQRVIYDPANCVEPGYFTAAIALQLARVRCAKFEAETPLSPVARRKIILAAAAYNRLGFVLANLPEHVSTCLMRAEDKLTLSEPLILDTLCFSTCLALRVRRQSAEQIVATYGTRMTKQFRKKIPQACHQIDSHAEALETLQLLAEPKPRRRPVLQIGNPSGQRQSIV